MTSGPRHRIRTRFRTDWFRVLIDLQYAGYSQTRVAKTIGAPRATLRGWKAGSEPPYEFGHSLLELWTEITGEALNARPMTID